MADPAAARPLDLDLLLQSWGRALRAERKSPDTIKSYTTGVRLYLRWHRERDPDTPPALDRDRVTAFVADLLDGGAEAATAANRHLAIRRFAAWLAEEGELDTDPLLGLKRPKIDQKLINPLTADQLRAMIAACAGKDLRCRRDEAIIRLMAETLLRAGEVVALTVEDINLDEGVVLVRRGKGGKGRMAAFGAQTARALDRYLRARHTHPQAATSPRLWLGTRGRAFSYWALYRALTARAEAAGITDFHPHRLRHTGADRWLSAGGSESGLMAVAGWARPEMLMRYTRARASARAAEEARNLNLGDL